MDGDDDDGDDDEMAMNHSSIFRIIYQTHHHYNSYCFLLLVRYDHCYSIVCFFPCRMVDFDRNLQEQNCNKIGVRVMCLESPWNSNMAESNFRFCPGYTAAIGISGQ